MKRSNPKVKKFLKRVACDCIDMGVLFHLVDEQHIVLEKGNEVSGSFLENDSLDVAIRKPTDHWFPVLVHEYCHLLQWKKKNKAWRDVSINFKRRFPKYKEDAVTVFWSWMSKSKNYPKNVIDLATKYTRNIEVDCEKMTYKMLKKLNLKGFEKELNKYKRESNSYLLYYNVMRETRKIWKFSPCEFYAVTKYLPNKWLDSYEIEDMGKVKNWEQYKETVKLYTL